MTHLSRKIAVVTGGARGIGAAVASRLAKDGAYVAVVDLNEVLASETAAQIVASGGEARSFGCDVAREEAVSTTIKQIEAAWGGVDVLVNNAGIIKDNLLFKMSVDEWDTVMNVHLRGSFLWARAVQTHMVKQRWGRIINLSSSSAYGSRGQGNYAAAKAGVQGFTKTLAIELGPFNINVNAIAPGFIATEMTRATAERVGMGWEEYQAQYLPAIPLRRIGQPSEIASVVSFLSGEDSAYLTGQIIDVAGGPLN